MARGRKGFGQKMAGNGTPRHKGSEISYRRWANSRPVTKAFPFSGKFGSREEVVEYLSSDTVQCLICGRDFAGNLGIHLRVHNLSAREYRILYDIPHTYTLVTQAYKEMKRETVTEQQIQQMKSMRPLSNGNRTRIKWHQDENRKHLETVRGKLTQEQMKFVVDNLGKLGVVALAKKFNMSRSGIYRVCKTYNKLEPDEKI